MFNLYRELLRLLAVGSFVEGFSDGEVDRIWCLLNVEIYRRGSDTVHNFLAGLDDVSSHCASEKARTALPGNFLFCCYLFVCFLCGYCVSTIIGGFSLSSYFFFIVGLFTGVLVFLYPYYMASQNPISARLCLTNFLSTRSGLFELSLLGSE